MKDKLEEEILGLCSDIASYVKENKECEKLYDSIIAKYEKLLKQKDQEMQRVVDEKERLRNGCRDDETRCPYYDLKDKVKQLEQQLKQEASDFDTLEVRCQELEAKILQRR